MKHATFVTLMLVLLAGMTVGCEKKKFTQKRFDTMISNGQSKMEVEKILGEPDARWETSWRWVDDDKTAKVLFDRKSGRVIGKQWQDMKRQDPDPEKEWREGDGPGSSSTERKTIVK